ncbi:MAG: hypothetical protein M3069_26895 [Chloroflexota bacterium]|nr:hypothetical protein [Chloroflexota bacterium]
MPAPVLRRADAMVCTPIADFGVPDEQWGEMVYAGGRARVGRSADPDELTALARQQLAGYKVPRSISVAPDLPHTASGKVLKRELRDRYWQASGARAEKPQARRLPNGATS